MIAVEMFCFAEEHLVECRAVFAFGDSESGGRVSLGVGVNYKTRKSLAAREAARLMAVVVFPTPPF